jgi:hypothetical protein
LSGVLAAEIRFSADGAVFCRRDEQTGGNYMLLTRSFVNFARTLRSRARCALGALLLTVGVLFSAAHAATTTVSVLIDADNNAASGCAIAKANGPFTGVERVLDTTVVADSMATPSAPGCAAM